MEQRAMQGTDATVYSVLLGLIVALGGALRLFDLAGPSLWLDEILHLNATREFSENSWWSHLVGARESMGGTENGTLYYALQALGQWVAPGDLGVRLLPALVGTATLPVMALAGWALGGARVALASTFLLAVSPLHVYFSREGRPYYLLAMLVVLLTYALLERRTKRGQWLSWLACLGGAYVGLHSVPLLLSFLALAALLALWDWRSDGNSARVPALHCVAAAGLALALAYGLYMTRSDTNSLDRDRSEEQVVFQESPVFQSPLTAKSARQFLASMTTSGVPSTVLGPRSWALMVMAFFGLVTSTFRRPRQALVVGGMFVLPCLVSVAALMAVGRWYGIRYTSAALPAFLFLVALGMVAVVDLIGKLAVDRVPRGRIATLGWLVLASLLVVVAAPNLAAAHSGPHTKLDWRGVAAFFDEAALEGEPILIPNDWPKICLDYYLRQRGREFEFVPLWESAANGEKEVAARPRGWLLTAGYRRSNEVRAWMHGFVPVLKMREEEMALFFFPDLVALLETRFAAGKGALFERQFEDMDRRFEFGGGEVTLQGWGWSYPENDGAGTDFQWAIGEQAELGLPVGARSSRTLRMRLRPFEYPEAPPQLVEVWLNDTLLAEFQLLPGWSEHELDVPASVWSSGADILSLRFTQAVRPAAVIEGSTDRRPLAAAFDFLEVIDPV